MTNTNDFNKELTERFADVFDYLNDVGINIEKCNDAEQLFNKLKALEVNPDGVYVEEYDSYYINYEHALRCLRSDERGFREGLDGLLTIDYCPHIINHRNKRVNTDITDDEVELLNELLEFSNERLEGVL